MMLYCARCRLLTDQAMMADVNGLLYCRSCAEKVKQA